MKDISLVFVFYDDVCVCVCGGGGGGGLSVKIFSERNLC